MEIEQYLLKDFESLESELKEKNEEYDKTVNIYEMLAEKVKLLETKTL